MPSNDGRDPRNDSTLIQAISHPIRVAFLKLLRERPVLTVAEGAAHLKDEVGSISILHYHLSILRDADLVETADGMSRQGAPMRLTDQGRSTLEIFGFPSVEGAG